MIDLAFEPRVTPLKASAVVALGADVAALAVAVLDRTDEELRALRGVGDPSALLVQSDDAAALPWAPGCFYLGQDPAAPTILLPTNLAPNLPPALLANAIARDRRRPASTGQVAVVVREDGRRTFISLVHARPIDRRTLAALTRPQPHQAPAREPSP